MADQSPTVQRLAAIGGTGIPVLQLKRLDEKLNDGDKKIAIVGEFHGVVKPEAEIDAYARKEITVEHEDADIEVQKGDDSNKVTPDNSALRMMFLTTHIAEYVTSLQSKPVDDATRNIELTRSESAVLATLFAKFKNEQLYVKQLLADATDADAPPVPFQAATIDKLGKARRKLAKATVADDEDVTSVNYDDVRLWTNRLISVAQTMEEELGSVQGFALAPSSDYSLLRAKHMYDTVEGLTASRDNLIYKVGNDHISEMIKIIKDVSADIEILDKDAYVTELFNLLDALNPADEDT